jgi:hypothetical protein
VMKETRGEIWLELNQVYHRVIKWRHVDHDNGDECTSEFVLATALDEDIADSDSNYVFEVKGCHEIWEKIDKYSAESKGDDVLVMSATKERGVVSLTARIMAREQFHELFEKPKIFGKLEALVVLRHEGRQHLVKDMEARAQIQGTTDPDGNIIAAKDTVELTMRCLGLDGEVKRFKMRARGLIPAYEAVVEEEQRTGSKMLLVIDADKGEWLTYNLNEIKDKVPVISKILKEFQRRRYIT